jgi:DeoR/GlpR family transcriptional regulator of sugar metabolism
LHADALFKRALMHATQRCVVLATNAKLGARAPHRSCALADVELLVVEHDAPPALTLPLEAVGVTLAVAAPPA